ncbi:hypothetical protein DXG01_008416 [Tephrocybe rancida]|nr:hypothetical protein DXG01_008416 [Tephrocybe rancida]
MSIEHAVSHIELVIIDDELNNIVSTSGHHIVIIVDNELIDAVIPQKGNIDGSLPPLPPLLDTLDAFSGKLLPPPPSATDAPNSMVPSQAK